MINEARLDAVIAELRMELDRVDRAIVVFEKLAVEKKVCRTRTPRARLKATPPPTGSRRTAAPPA